MKLAYFFTKKHFGKVITSLKVFAVRLPAAFGMFYGKIAKLDKKLALPAETALLIRQYVAQLNVCLFCMDASRAAAIKQSMSVAKFDGLNNYDNNPLFSEADKAALNYAKALTVEKKVSAESFARMAKHYTERELCEIVYLVATEHVYNLTNLGLNIHSDMLCDIAKRNQN